MYQQLRDMNKHLYEMDEVPILYQILIQGLQGELKITHLHNFTISVAREITLNSEDAELSQLRACHTLADEAEMFEISVECSLDWFICD